MSLLSCEPPCTALNNEAPQDVCHRADAGAVVANQPFELSAEISTRATTTCEVIVDGGNLTLQLSGTACPVAPSNNPVVFATRTVCVVPSLPEGEYVLNDLSRTRLTGGNGDAGVRHCTL